MSSRGPLLHAIAGSLGGAIAMMLFYPLERARIEFQTRCRMDESDKERQTFSRKVTLFDCLQHLYRSNELYKGLSNNVFILAISNFVFFYVNEKLKQQSTVRLLNNTAAGICNVLITNPLWVANIRLISKRNIVDINDASLLEELRNIVRSSTILEWWSGTGASMLLVCNPIIQFFTYESMKVRQVKRSHGDFKASHAFIVGAVSKLIATVLTYPLQLAQTIQRIERRKESTLACLLAVYRRDKFSGLYTGMKAKLLQTVLTAAFTFLTYEQIVKTLHNALKVSLSNTQASVV